MQVIILRGIPGAGKTRYRKSFPPDAGYCSADDFFDAEGGGTYQFDPKRLREAHAQCLHRFIHAVKFSELKTMLVDNTNIRATEVAPYYAVGEAYGHEVKVVTFIVDPRVAGARNVHQVPLPKVESMHAALLRETELFPPWWKHEIREQK